jgi:uncharacterized protein (UPF0179 family)
MLYRVVGFTFALLAVIALVNGAAVYAGDKNVHDGKVVSVKADKLTMETKGKTHMHEVAPNAKITCDGKKCDLLDLKKGTFIRVMTDNNDRAVSIQAFVKTTAPAGTGKQ